MLVGCGMREQAQARIVGDHIRRAARTAGIPRDVLSLPSQLLQVASTRADISGG
jgi:hypothetical protein